MTTLFSLRNRHAQKPLTKPEPVCDSQEDIQKMRELYIQRVGNVHNLDWYRSETQPRNS